MYIYEIVLIACSMNCMFLPQANAVEDLSNQVHISTYLTLGFPKRRQEMGFIGLH